MEFKLAFERAGTLFAVLHSTRYEILFAGVAASLDTLMMSTFNMKIKNMFQATFFLALFTRHFEVFPAVGSPLSNLCNAINSAYRDMNN